MLQGRPTLAVADILPNVFLRSRSGQDRPVLLCMGLFSRFCVQDGCSAEEAL
jgi:hypothetical protein